MKYCDQKCKAFRACLHGAFARCEISSQDAKGCVGLHGPVTTLRMLQAKCCVHLQSPRDRYCTMQTRRAFCTQHPFWGCCMQNNAVAWGSASMTDIAPSIHSWGVACKLICTVQCLKDRYCTALQPHQAFCTQHPSLGCCMQACSMHLHSATPCQQILHHATAPSALHMRPTPH